MFKERAQEYVRDYLDHPGSVAGQQRNKDPVVLGNKLMLTMQGKHIDTCIIFLASSQLLQRNKEEGKEERENKEDGRGKGKKELRKKRVK